VRNSLLGVAAVVTSLGCTTTKQEPKRGELVLFIQTDLSVPKDVSSVRVEVVENGRVQFAQSYSLGPAPLLQMPATLSIVAGEDPADPVSIRILARQGRVGGDADGGVPRVLREIVTTVPPDRSALLPITLQWLCADEKSLVVEDGEVSTACGEGETCVAGTCQEQAVDSSTLPDLDVRVTDGTAPDSGCFDVLTCQGDAPLAAVDVGSCTVPAPSGDRKSWNFALRLPLGSGGTCNQSHCYVPLNEGADGWRAGADGEVLLPESVCEGETPLAVAVSTGCPTKTSLMPVCGAATRFQTPAPGTPTSAPGEMSGEGGAGAGGGGGGGAGGDATEPEVVLLKGVAAPRHVVIEPLGVYFVAQASTSADAVFWCALAGCEGRAQAQWQGPVGALADGFAHNASLLSVWAWEQQSLQIRACPFPGGCSMDAVARVLATTDAPDPPQASLTGAVAMTESSVIFREGPTSTRIQICSMLDVGCGASSATLVTDTSPVLSLTATDTGLLVWANAAGELKHCQLEDCPGTVSVNATGQQFSWGPLFSNDVVVWSSARSVRACTLNDCAATQRDVFTAVSAPTALAIDGSYAYVGFSPSPNPPVHELVKAPLDGSMQGQTLRTGSGLVVGTGVDGDYVYSFIVDPLTAVGDLVRTSKDAMPMP
jgi:hypothetical protein